MKRPSTLTVLAVGALAAVIAYSVARAARGPAARPTTDPAADAVLGLLGAEESQRAQLAEIDRTFPDDLARLRADVDTRRAELAKALEDPASTREQVNSALDASLQARDALEHRVLDYVMSVRGHLSLQQQKRLLGLCAEQVRRGRGWQHGQNAESPGRGGGGRGPRGRGN